VIIHLRTWRFGSDTVLVYHGSDWAYDALNAILTIHDPVLEEGVGVATVVSVLNTDEFTVQECRVVYNPLAPTECDHKPASRS
jgi:hypothetical protein